MYHDPKPKPVCLLGLLGRRMSGLQDLYIPNPAPQITFDSVLAPFEES